MFRNLIGSELQQGLGIYSQGDKRTVRDYYLPVSAGLSIRRDIQGVEEFYSLISGVEVRMEGFVDLTSLVVLARYKFQAKNMTAMSVQVHGTLLNKSASTGDDYWGLRWEEIPEALRCYETFGSGL